MMRAQKLLGDVAGINWQALSTETSGQAGRGAGERRGRRGAGCGEREGPVEAPRRRRRRR
jgi:hypothetical protein